MWTIFNAAGKAVANSDFQPNNEELAARGERAVFHQEIISLDEIMLNGNSVKYKPLVVLSMRVDRGTATVSVGCDDPAVLQIPLIIGETCVMKPQGDFVINGEAGVRVVIDFEREFLRGKRLEVIF